MKKRTRYKIAGICVVLLALGLLIVIPSLQNAKLQATLSDGTVVKIEKVEVSNSPYYDARNFLERSKSWLCQREWGRAIFKALKIDIPYDNAVFTYDGGGREIFQVWYSLSDPSRGFFSRMTKEGLVDGRSIGKGSGGSWGNGLSMGEVSLVDEDGCTYNKGWMYVNYKKPDATLLLIQSFSFESFNRASETQRLVIKFPGEKQSVTFVLKNPQPCPAPAASALAVSLPSKQDLGAVSVILESLQREKGRWNPKFGFKRNGIDVGQNYAVVWFTVNDTQGGSSGAVCARAVEWIIQGQVQTQRLAAIHPSKRVPLKNLLPLQPQEYRLVDLPSEASGFLLRAYLVGAGTYVLDANDMVSAAGVNDLEKQKDVFQKIPWPRNETSASQMNSENYWREAERKSFYWGQQIYGGGSSKMLFLTDKPALIFRAAPGNTQHSALLLSNPALQWDFCEKDFSGGRWGAMPLDWKGHEGPQTVEIGYAEATPFELHILPTEAMRQSVLPPPEAKTQPVQESR